MDECGKSPSAALCSTVLRYDVACATPHSSGSQALQMELFPHSCNIGSECGKSPSAALRA